MTTADQVLGRRIERPAAAPARPVAASRNAAVVPASLQDTVAGGVWRTGVLAALSWLALGVLTLAWKNVAIGFSDWAFTTELGVAALVVALLLLAVALLGAHAGRVGRTLRPAGQWLIAWPLLLTE